MLPLTLEITDQNGIQHRPALRNLRFAKTFYGGEDLWLTFVLDREGDLDHPDVAYGNDVVLRSGLTPHFRGEIRQIESDLETVTVKCLGNWVYLDDYGYGGQGKLWCDSRFGKWRSGASDDNAAWAHEKYAMDKSNRLYIAPRKDEWFGVASRFGVLYYVSLYDAIKRISFDYEAGLWYDWANWRISLYSCNLDFTNLVEEWFVAGGLVESGVKDIEISPERQMVYFQMRRTANGVYPDETGYNFLRVTNLRIWGESGPLSLAIESPSVIHIAEDVINQVNAATPISAVADRVQESLFVRDTFTAGNGTLLNARNPDIDKERGGWIFGSGQYDIQGNEAHSSLVIGGLAVAVINSGQSDGVVSVDATTSAVAAWIPSALIFRYQNINNFWALYIEPTDGRVSLGKWSAPAWTWVWRRDIGIELSFTYNLMVKLRGDSIDCYIGGVWRGGTNDPWLQTETEHGLYANDLDMNFDNFEVFQALPLWPLFYEGGQSCHKALADAVSYGDWDFRALGWGVEPGGNRLYLKRAERDRVRYVVPPHHASRLSARGQTDKGFVTEAWGKYIDEDGVEGWTDKYYAHVTSTGIVANTTPPVPDDDSAENVFGVKRDRTIAFGRVDAYLAIEYLKQYLIEHAHPQVKSAFEAFGPVQDRFKGGAWIQPYAMEMGYIVQIPYFRAVEVEGVVGSDIRWGVGGQWDTTFLLVAIQYDAERGRARLIPEGASEDLERLIKYSREFERLEEHKAVRKREEASYKR